MEPVEGITEKKSIHSSQRLMQKVANIPLISNISFWKETRGSSAVALKPWCGLFSLVWNLQSVFLLVCLDFILNNIPPMRHGAVSSEPGALYSADSSKYTHRWSHCCWSRNWNKSPQLVTEDQWPVCVCVCRWIACEVVWVCRCMEGGLSVTSQRQITSNYMTTQVAHEHCSENILKCSSFRWWQSTECVSHRLRACI